MQDSANGNSAQPGREENGPDEPGTPDASGRDATESGPVRVKTSQAAPGTAQASPEAGQTRPETGPAKQAQPKARRTGWRRFAVYAAGSVLGIGIGFGIGGLINVLGSGSGPASVIPSPPRANAKFVEDDNGTGQDNQQNILQSTVPGLVHVVSSRGAPVGLGVVLTPSGLAVTSNQILQGAGQVTVRVVLSGRGFAARVVGSDAAAGLALLQIEGGSSFRTAAIGNSRDFAVGDVVTSVGSAGTTRTFTLHLGNVTSLNGAAAVGGMRLTGLLRTTSQVLASQEIGGPLVNLSGQVVGIDVAGAGNSLHSVGFAIPINEALTVARQIDAKHS
jgi:S1-C subfamily serine protease